MLVTGLGSTSERNTNPHCREAQTALILIGGKDKHFTRLQVTESPFKERLKISWIK